MSSRSPSSAPTESAALCAAALAMVGEYLRRRAPGAGIVCVESPADPGTLVALLPAVERALATFRAEHGGWT